MGCKDSNAGPAAVTIHFFAARIKLNDYKRASLLRFYDFWRIFCNCDDSVLNGRAGESEYRPKKRADAPKRAPTLCYRVRRNDNTKLFLK
jgi:hypothetical protein